MEADWSVALGDDDPAITVPWSGDDLRGLRFVDLRGAAHLIDEIEEARSRPPLRLALLVLNGSDSPLWTAKCDAWTSAEKGNPPLDPYEMDAQPGETGFGAGSYIDLLPRDTATLSSFDRQERWMREVTEKLRAIPASAARVELVLRHAEVHGASGFAVTWFVEGCGATQSEAIKKWGEALTLALPALMEAGPPHFGSRTGDDTMKETGE
jgi:hypothetical protein